MTSQDFSWKRWEEFERWWHNSRLFGIHARHFADVNIWIATRLFTFDVIKFDEWCQKYHGHDSDPNQELSLHEFVERKFGAEAAVRIAAILEPIPDEIKEEKTCTLTSCEDTTPQNPS